MGRPPGIATAAAFLPRLAALALVGPLSNSERPGAWERRGGGCASKRLARSEQAQFLERRAIPVAHDEVIEEPHIDERERPGKAAGEVAVGGAWSCNTAGMIVATDDRPGVVPERAAHDGAWIHVGAVHGAVEHLLEGDDPMAAVEEQTGEDLVAVAPEARLEVAPGVLRRGERAAVAAQPGGLAG